MVLKPWYKRLTMRKGEELRERLRTAASDQELVSSRTYVRAL